MTKQIYIINGSPRKNWNTSKMCESFAKGVIDAGGYAEIINLYDIDFKGCRACSACKLKNGKNYGFCSYPDELKEILNRISLADGICLATPIYFGDVSGVMKMFIERLVYPFVRFDKQYTPIPPKKLKTAVIYTMNVDEKLFLGSYIGKHNLGPVGFFENWITHLYEKPQRICAFNTYQYYDYSKYDDERWDINDKIRQHEEVFPKDLENAYNVGKNFV